ncbi:MAG: hypothetical protein SGJ09_13770 [Phycisphaerae bacterium]|nr:hypothetical protein [Phycisphaerae bacterium]
MHRLLVLSLILLTALADISQAAHGVQARDEQPRFVCCGPECTCGPKCACCGSAPETPAEPSGHAKIVPAQPKLRIEVLLEAPPFAQIDSTSPSVEIDASVCVRPAHPDSHDIRVRNCVILT